jgi:glycosyltransferase involved in cell wall biosynthesis
LAVQSSDHVRFVGEISGPALRSLVAGASALLHPSLYEGFGFPPLEAMAVGCPCVVSNATSLPEVCGDAVVYCDATNPTDMANQLRRVLSDAELRNSLVSRGRARAAAFPWSRSAELTLAALERVMR